MTKTCNDFIIARNPKNPRTGVVFLTRYCIAGWGVMVAYAHFEHDIEAARAACYRMMRENKHENISLTPSQTLNGARVLDSVYKYGTFPSSVRKLLGLRIKMRDNRHEKNKLALQRKQARKREAIINTFLLLGGAAAIFFAATCPL